MTAATRPLRCGRCKRAGSRDALEMDGKPSSARFRLEARRLGQFEALSRAADRGEDFDCVECARCYGEGWCAG